jgi:hypothetical protein
LAGNPFLDPAQHLPCIRLVAGLDEHELGPSAVAKDVLRSQSSSERRL